MLKKIAIIFLVVIVLFVSAKIAFYHLFGGGTNITYESPVWSKDGSRIYFIKKIEHWSPSISFTMSPGSLNELECYIMSMRADGKDKRVIIKYISKRSTEYIRNLNLHVFKALYPSSAYNLIILPNNNELIFFLWHPEGEKKESAIYKVNVDGTNLVKLTELGEVNSVPRLFISPRGIKVSYTKTIWGTEDNHRGAISSSWLLDINGKDNYMVCGEESEVEGWTKNNYLIISTFADSEGNAKIKYGYKDRPVYTEDVIDRTLIYDPMSKMYIKNIPNYYSSKKTQKELISSGFIFYDTRDTGISPDGKKKIFVENTNLGVMNTYSKKILLKGKKH